MSQITKQSVLKSYRFPLILLASIAVGCVIGVIAGEKAVVLKPFGDVFLNLIFTLVVPIVFFSISSSRRPFATISTNWWGWYSISS